MTLNKRLITLVVVIIFGLSLILAPVLSQVSPAQAAVTWTEYSGEVTLDERYVVDAWVIKDGTTYKMWYTHGKTDLSITEIVNTITTDLNLTNLKNDIKNLDLSQFLDDLSDLVGDVDDLRDLLDGTSTVIGYATSNDGKAWTVQKSEALAGSSGSAWDSVGAPCVIKDDSTYKMWYTRVNTDLTQTSLETILTDIAGVSQDDRKAAILNLLGSTRTVIDYTTSTDGGITWAVPNQDVLPSNSDNAWDSVADPCVIEDNGTYEMWYTRPNTDLNQSELNTILTNIDTFDINDLMGVLDGTNTVIGYATSDDGITWTLGNTKVLPGVSDVAAWDSVADPSVVKTGSTYEMWYTNGETDLRRANFLTLLSEVAGLADSIRDILVDFAAGNFEQFLTDLSGLNIDTIKGLLGDTSTVIGYATSDDGETWTVQDSEDIVGSTGSPSSGVAAPSVVKTGSRYQMWYTEGIDAFTLQNLVDLALGSDLPIGYAYYIPPSPAGPPGPPPPPPPPGVTDVSDYVDEDGRFTQDVTSESEDGKCELTIDEDTTGLTEDGEPLSEISILEMEEPPPPPEDSSVIGLVYDFGPDRATFDPPITLTFTYDPADIPEGVNEEDLVIAMWDDAVGEWVELSPCTVDPVTHTITAPVSHFTAFAVLAYTRPAVFTLSALTISPTEVDVGETITISVLVTNAGDLADSYEVILKVDEVVVATEKVTLDGGASQKVTLTTSEDVAGTYTVDVDGLSGTFLVGAPAAFVVSALSITPAEVDIGEIVTISVVVANTGDLTGSYKVTLKVDEVVVATEEVTLAGGASQEVTFTTAKNIAGTYTVDIDGQVGAFEVRVAPAPAAFTLSALSISPAEVDIGEIVTVSVLITNTGDLTGSYKVTLKVDEVVVATEEVTLAGGASQEVTFTTSEDVAGTYTVDVDGQVGVFEVKAVPVPVPAPAAFTLSALTISPAEVDIGETVTISVLITNTGDLTGSYKVTLKVDEVVVATEEVTLDGGASQKVTLTTAEDVAGTYTVDVDGQVGTFEVKAPPSRINWPVLGGTIAGVIIVGLLVYFLIIRRRTA